MANFSVVKGGNADMMVSLIGNMCADFAKECEDETQDAFHQAGVKTKSYVRANSPRSKGKDSGAYARSWVMDESHREGHHKVVITNRRHWQLTHLLNDGHVIRNQHGGPFGRVDGDHHLDRAYEVGKAELERLLGVKL